ncbi:transcriptional regulator [Marinomonas sp. CT5]|uniref:helix-turn-helix transcriptional regulator n=1 Tax=Marinomonas sp. CT5 TaxID=2066133 RepID=UPI001BAF618C|nr:WYL domain-containing protein [Marinomonas sp. CT5]QUX96266.1 transcriptional regulator [Marinomonas sp. CT5]
MTRANTTKHLDRLEQLTAILKSEDALTSKMIAEELNISERTLFRDIGILRERGLPIEADKGRGGGIKLHRHWGVGRLSLESQEIIDLLISLAIAESMGPTLFMRNIDTVRQKLMASFSPKQKEKMHQLRKRIHVGEQASPDVLQSFSTKKQETKATIETLHHAFLFNRRLSIIYQDFYNQETQRDIEAHYLYLGFPVWYLLAWDYLRNDVRIFRYDRIKQADILPQEFTVRPLSDFHDILTKQNVRTL